MITIVSEKFIRFENGRPVVEAELNVDNSAELSAADAIEGRQLHQGSAALVIKEGKLAILSGDGHWYIDGEVIS